MNSLNVNVAAVGRFVAATALATIALTAGATFIIDKATPTGTSSTAIVQEWKVGSGGKIGHISETGILSVSGAVKTGTGLTVGDADGSGCTKILCSDGNCTFATATCP